VKVLVTGAGGLVGRAVAEHCSASGDEVVLYGHTDLDITDREKVFLKLLDQRPDVVLNCAAWTNVDACESDPEKAYAVNATGPENLASACKEIGAVFVTISTDYVFDGQKDGFYTQLDTPNPQSVYAASKLEGERRPQAAYERSIIVRTGYIFGTGGANFLSTVVARARKGEKLKVITDTYGTPTYANDLAARLRELAVANAPGIYHVVNSGPGVSFEQFTREVLSLLGKTDAVIEPVLAASLNRPARRPYNSRLRCLRSVEIGLSPLPNWESALARFVRSELNADFGPN
jgi:dTDP-4-dehydrorhamnose reductase